MNLLKERLFLLVFFGVTCAYEKTPKMFPFDKKLELPAKQYHFVRGLVNVSNDIMQEGLRHIMGLYKIKQDNIKSAAFEVGYITFRMQDKYRKMIDRFNASVVMGTKLYKGEIVMYLHEIEMLYWEILHLSNMMHEVERKHKVLGSSLHEDYEEHVVREVKQKEIKDAWQEKMRVTTRQPKKTKKPKKINPKQMEKHINERLKNLNVSRRPRKGKRFPLEYGWYNVVPMN